MTHFEIDVLLVPFIVGTYSWYPFKHWPQTLFIEQESHLLILHKTHESPIELGTNSDTVWLHWMQKLLFAQS